MTEAVTRARFPILGARGVGVDWQLVVDHSKQADANHYQTVKQLASRGGLSWSELHAVLHNRPWQKMDENTAINECRKIEADYLAAVQPSHDAEIATLRAEVARQQSRADQQAEWAIREATKCAELEAALTPSAETKAAYMGEFFVPLPDTDEDSNELVRQINVPWTTIKEIMAAIRSRAVTAGTSTLAQP